MPIRMRMEGLYLTVRRKWRGIPAYLASQRGSVPGGSQYRNPLDNLDFLVPIFFSSYTLTKIFTFVFVSEGTHTWPAPTSKSVTASEVDMNVLWNIWGSLRPGVQEPCG